MKKTKMNKNILVSVLLIASVLLLTAVASAATTNLNIDEVRINGINVDTVTEGIAVTAGETITVKVIFTVATSGLGFDESASDVKIKVTLEGNDDVTAVTSKFDVEEGKTYSKVLTMKVPSNFDDDDYSFDMDLNIEISSDDDEVEADEDYLDVLTVQRTPYEVAIKSVITSNSIDAGKTMPVEVVLKNIGYNEVKDVYVTVSIPELNIKKSAYLGDIVTEPYEDSWFSDDDDENTISGRLTLELPYSAKAGIYTLVVEVENDDVTSTRTQEITIANSVSEVAIKSGNDLILLNPTNNLVVYTVKYNANEAIVVVPAVSSKTVAIDTTADTEVSVYAGATLLSTVKYTATSESATELELTNPVFVLTVILAIVFLVLLVVLVVLITKKPQKAEEFGESYY
ncbi:hypothetical protein M0R19_02350 [Candidatus Pacearchaeota archaeon]|nr:hypothetical protein [Candidatus Pacearchaeota archaeon]